MMMGYYYNDLSLILQAIPSYLLMSALKFKVSLSSICGQRTLINRRHITQKTVNKSVSDIFRMLLKKSTKLKYILFDERLLLVLRVT
jgi:hypothetical protein